MWYYRRLSDGLVVMHTRPEHAPQLEELQRRCFPTLDAAERFKAAHYRLHIDFDHVDHTFADIIQGGWLTSHQPEGEWLYGADVGVDPAYRGRGIAKALYAARQEVVWRLGLHGQVTAGMMRGFGGVKDRMTADAYYQGVVAGRIKDPTLS